MIFKGNRILCPSRRFIWGRDVIHTGARARTHTHICRILQREKRGTSTGARVFTLTFLRGRRPPQQSGYSVAARYTHLCGQVFGVQTNTMTMYGFFSCTDGTTYAFTCFPTGKKMKIITIIIVQNKNTMNCGSTQYAQDRLVGGGCRYSQPGARRAPPNNEDDSF